VCDTLDLNTRERRDAEFAALLHDVGKIRIPAEIINKPGKLTYEEFEVIKTHTVEGEKLLSQVGGLLGNVGHIVRSCHADWDGTGYPDGLAGEAIPRVARIVRACDAYSAMTTDRPYRKALPIEDAIAELRRCSGTDFDPEVVEALAAALQTRP
jgi:HD-GYP domain-containing protein (c-di-GMP phosphodiesterase class II)